MPYIITTHAAEDYHGPRGVEKRYGSSTRRAVATLDEALEDIVSTVRAIDLTEYRRADPGWTLGLVWAQVDGLPESGGTVGPLPDGTVIQVERVTPEHLVFLLNLKPQYVRRGGIPTAELIEAFNAAA